MAISQKKDSTFFLDKNGAKVLMGDTVCSIHSGICFTVAYINMRTTQGAIHIRQSRAMEYINISVRGEGCIKVPPHLSTTQAIAYLKLHGVEDPRMFI